MGLNGSMLGTTMDASTPTVGLRLTPGRIALAMSPFTPLSFSTDLPLALLRLGVYSSVAYLAWKKSKPISYIAMGALGVSVLTSLSTSAWSGEV
jgi:hypothetical protein